MLSLLVMIAVFRPYIAAGSERKAGEMALPQAAKVGAIETIKTFIERGADVNAKDKDGVTALMWAAAGGYAEVVQVLLQA